MSAVKFDRGLGELDAVDAGTRLSAWVRAPAQTPRHRVAPVNLLRVIAKPGPPVDSQGKLGLSEHPLQVKPHQRLPRSIVAGPEFACPVRDVARRDASCPLQPI